VALSSKMAARNKKPDQLQANRVGKTSPL